MDINEESSLEEIKINEDEGIGNNNEKEGVKTMDIFELQSEKKAIKKELKRNNVEYSASPLYADKEEEMVDFDVNKNLYKILSITKSKKNVDNNLKNRIKLYNERVKNLWEYRQKVMNDAEKLFSRQPLFGDKTNKRFNFNKDKSSQVLKTVLSTIIDVKAGKNVNHNGKTLKNIELYDVKDRKNNSEDNEDSKVDKIGLEDGITGNYISLDGKDIYRGSNGDFQVVNKSKHWWTWDTWEKAEGVNDYKDSKAIRNFVLRDLSGEKKEKDKYSNFITSTKQENSTPAITLTDLKLYNKEEKNIIIDILRFLKDGKIEGETISNEKLSEEYVKNNIVKLTQDLFLNKKIGNVGNYTSDRIDKLVELLKSDKSERFERILNQKRNFDKEKEEGVNYVVLGTNLEFLLAQKDTIAEDIVSRIGSVEDMKKIKVDFICSTHTNLEDTKREDECMEEFMGKLKDLVIKKIEDKNLDLSQVNGMFSKNACKTENFYNGYHNTVETFLTLMKNKSKSDPNMNFVLCGFDSFAERAMIDVLNDKKTRGMLESNKVGFLSTNAMEWFKTLDDVIFKNSFGGDEEAIKKATEQLQIQLKFKKGDKKKAFGGVCDIYFNEEGELNNDFKMIIELINGSYKIKNGRVVVSKKNKKENDDKLRKAMENIVYKKKAFILAQKLENYAKSIYVLNERYRDIIKEEGITSVGAEMEMKNITKDIREGKNPIVKSSKDYDIEDDLSNLERMAITKMKTKVENKEEEVNNNKEQESSKKKSKKKNKKKKVDSDLSALGEDLDKYIKSNKKIDDNTKKI